MLPISYNGQDDLKILILFYKHVLIYDNEKLLKFFFFKLNINFLNLYYTS